MNKPSMRDKMPGCAEWIDNLREAFGKEMINAQIAKGMRGEKTFFAAEKGHVLGARQTTARACVKWDDQGRSYSYDIPAGTSFEDAREIERLAQYQANLRGMCHV